MYQLYELIKLISETPLDDPEANLRHVLEAWKDHATQLIANTSLADDDLSNAAIELYSGRSDDNIEIDDNAFASHGDTGAFVSAWVWVPREKYDENFSMEDHENE